MMAYASVFLNDLAEEFSFLRINELLKRDSNEQTGSSSS
jgi:hypothetical protein